MYLLVGAGGHGRTIADMIEIAAYVDAKRASWLKATHLASDAEGRARCDLDLALGVGCVDTEGCTRRRKLGQSYVEAGLNAPSLVHSRASVSPEAEIGDGAQILPGAVVQPFAHIGRFCLINSGSIIDHDCMIGGGTHVATGAILGGGVVIGMDCMIGMGAVVLPYTRVPDGTLVKAATRYPPPHPPTR